MPLGDLNLGLLLPLLQAQQQQTNPVRDAAIGMANLEKGLARQPGPGEIDPRNLPQGGKSPLGLDASFEDLLVAAAAAAQQGQSGRGNRGPNVSSGSGSANIRIQEPQVEDRAQIQQIPGLIQLLQAIVRGG